MLINLVGVIFLILGLLCFNFTIRIWMLRIFKEEFIKAFSEASSVKHGATRRQIYFILIMDCFKLVPFNITKRAESIKNSLVKYEH